MNKTEKYKKKDNGYLNYFVQLFFFIILLFLLYNISEKSPYIKQCNAQYGRLIISLLVSGLISNFMSGLFRGVKIDYHEDSLSKLSKLGLIVSSIFMAVIGLLVWLGLELDNIDIYIFISSLISASAGFFEIKKSHYNKLMFWSSDVPLFVGCSIVLIIKINFENELTQEYIASIIDKLPDFKFDPQKYDKIGELRQLLKDNFWIGMSTGIVTIQLVNSQVTQIMLKIFGRD